MPPASLARIQRLRARSRGAAAQARRAPAVDVPLPAPVRGWNARDEGMALKPTDALVLDNLIPRFGECELRKGHASHATGLGATVESLLALESGATAKLLGAAGGALYDVTSAGAVGAALASGFASDVWDGVVMNGTLGLVNGADAPQVYDGSTVGAMTVSGVGLTVADLIGVQGHRSRSYFWTDDSLAFWYSASGALGGALTEFDLALIGDLRGKIVAMGSATVRGKDGAWGGAGGEGEDLLVIVTSGGQVAAYRGSDPGDATDFGLVGVYPLGGRPLGRRAIEKIGDDLAIATTAGHVSLRTVFERGDLAAAVSPISSRIRKAAKEAADAYAANSGWQVLLHEDLALFNVPVSATTSQQQVLNTATGAWCRFTGLNARAWARLAGNLYFGGSGGTVWQADTGTTDAGAAIQFRWRTAWNPLGRRGLGKRVTAVRPVFRALGAVTFGVQVAADYSRRQPALDEVTLSANLLTWGQVGTPWAQWLTPWGSDEADVISIWLSRGARGELLSVESAGSTSKALSWLRTDVKRTMSEGTL